VLAGPLLPGLIEHQHRVSRITQPGDCEGADLVHGTRRVPGDPFQQSLHLVRRGVPGCSAGVQQFLRGRSPISPVTYLRAWRRGSTGAKHGAMRGSGQIVISLMRIVLYS